MMIHYMKLLGKPFDKIKSGNKTIEARMLDEKRRSVKVGDMIEFSKLPERRETLKVLVTGLSIFDSFTSLYSNFDKSRFGYSENTGIGDEISDIRKIYSEKDEKKFGVVGIHIKLLE